jgi:cysteinyl-tRNA synthetase
MVLSYESADGLLRESVGQRVSIRLRDPDGGFRDLLGMLVAMDQVERRDGSIATFDKTDVVAFRIVGSP